MKGDETIMLQKGLVFDPDTGLESFSSDCQEHFIQTLKKVKKIAEQQVNGTIQWVGVATSASRIAANAQAFYTKIRDELGIAIIVITPQEEGHLGFLTAAAVSKVAREWLVALDSGHGSFQVTTEIGERTVVAKGEIGYAFAQTALFNEVRKRVFRRGEEEPSPNPVSIEEAEKLVAILEERQPLMPEELKEKLLQRETTVVGAGNKHNIVAVGFIAASNLGYIKNGSTTFTRTHLWDAITHYCGRDDKYLESQDFAEKKEAVVGLILLYSIMKSLKIPKITYAVSNGNCEGLLVDDRHWNQ
jgi:exopolyphosphatase/pppGpp-phosphohydrolase